MLATLIAAVLAGPPALPPSEEAPTSAPPATSERPENVSAPPQPAGSAPLAAPRADGTSPPPQPQRPKNMRQVPFPLQNRDVERPELRTAPAPRKQIVDLRDPFVHRTRPRATGKTAAQLMLPDLKDPFAHPRLPRSKRFVAFPGDIRNPFAPNLAKRRATRKCKPASSKTGQGVAIQRPGQQKTKPKPGEHDCKGPVVLDLRDPFK